METVVRGCEIGICEGAEADGAVLGGEDRFGDFGGYACGEDGITVGIERSLYIHKSRFFCEVSFECFLGWLEGVMSYGIMICMR